MLFEEKDTPRKVLMDILQTDPVKSPVVPLEPQPSVADTQCPSLELSEWDLSNPTIGVTSVAKRLTRERPRRSLNVTAFVERVEKDYAENEDDNSAQQDSSLSLSNATNLSLKTPYVSDQTQKIVLRRRVSYRQRITANEFDDVVNKMCQEQGVSSFTQSESILSNVAHADAALEVTNDIIHSNTALYAQTDTAEISKAATTEDKSTVEVSPTQRGPQQAELEPEEDAMVVTSGIEEDSAAEEQEPEMASQEEEEEGEEVEAKVASNPEEEEQDTDSLQEEVEEGRNRTIECIERQSRTSEGALLVPVPNSTSSSSNVQLSPEQKEAAEEPDGDEGNAVGDGDQLEEVQDFQEDVEEFEENYDGDDDDEDDDDDQELEEPPIDTPDFVRARRKTFQLPDATPFKPQPSSSTAGVPPAKAKPVRKRRSRAQPKNDGLPKNYLMKTFRHFAKTKVSGDVYSFLKDTTDTFLERMAEDLETFAAHAGRKTIEVEDVELLLRRQGYVNDKVPVQVLIEKYLRMDQRKILIPIATSGNAVFPKMKKR
ncbi:uncharacterized protein cenpt [Stigmatopora argus]